MSDVYRDNVVLDGTPSVTDVLSSGGRGSGPRGDRTRRSWTAREEEVLILALKDLVINQWKTDNGFRAGYQTRVVEFMKRELPDTDIKVHPHINSKVLTWKKCYYSLALILDRSGVGFNLAGDYKIECNDDQWNQIVKADSNARYMRLKSWPFWEDWKLIYGKDRAIRARVEGVGQAHKKLNSNPVSTSETHTETFNFSLDDFYTHEQIHESLNQETGAESCSRSVKSPRASTKTSKKRNAVEAMDAILEAMNKLNEDTNNHLEKLTTRIGYDFDLNEKRSEVSRILGGVPGLSQKLKFIASDILVKEPERLELFIGMTDFDKAAYVMHILEEKNAI